MTTRVFLRPDAATIEANNGIGRVVHAQHRYLPEYGIELVGSEDRADVISGHTHDYGAKRIDHVAVHGLYWTGDEDSGKYDNWHREANTRIIAAIRRARAVTVPSNWVAYPFQRDMRINPHVIGHGIDFETWQPGAAQNYVLWNKNRRGDACNPHWAWELAKRGAEVFSTFEPEGLDRPFGLHVTGALKEPEMRRYIQDAGVYLATTKETFGIGTLEAMASAVPVLGFNHGGTADIVTHKINGYLAAPGDVADLWEGLQYIKAHRAELGAAARETASRYTWASAVRQYADLFRALAGSPEPTGVAVVITCHNYGRFVAACLESVLAQSYAVDEIIVVDDGSTDNSRAEIGRYRERVRVIEQDNQGVAAARNNGIVASGQPFVMCLDADDMLDPRYVAVCRQALLADRGQGLAWTGMSVLRDGQVPTGNVWTGGFNWDWQATARIPPATTIPTGAMFRRSMWERAGGYQQQYAPGEDAEFYTRGLSVGFTAAKATEMPLFLYRDHGQGAHRSRPYIAIDEWHPWMRDREYPLGAPSLEAPNVRSYSRPAVSVIIPVGPGHARYLPDALASLVGQNMREWEVIVVDDSDDADVRRALVRFPFAVYAQTGTVAAGPGKARNIGLELAQAPLTLFLDADDQLAPGALAGLCAAYAGADGRYVYGDWQAMGSADVETTGAYVPPAWLDFAHLDRKHAITVLMATEDARRLKFDEALPFWEDWDFFARAALAGIWGQHADVRTLYLRRSPAGRTARAFNKPNGVIDLLRKRYEGRNIMGCSTCGGNGRAIMAARDAWAGLPQERANGLSVQQTVGGRAHMVPIDPNQVQPVRMEFVGDRTGSITYGGLRGSGRTYRGGRNPTGRFINAHPADVETLEAGGDWRRVAPAFVETLAAAPIQPVKVETPATPVAVAAVIAKPAEQVVEVGTGHITRKRKTGKMGRPSELRDLPPLDAGA